MPESFKEALKRAKEHHFKRGDIVKAKSGGHYILPHGIKSSAARGAYPALREKGYNPEAASKIAWYIEKKNK